MILPSDHGPASVDAGQYGESRVKVKLLASGIAVGAEVMVDQLRRMGFDTSLETLEQVTYVSQLERGNFDVIRFSFTWSVDDPAFWIAPFFLTGGARNYSTWSFPEVDALYARQDSLLDPVARRAVVQDLERKIIDIATMPCTTMYEGRQFYYPQVKHFPNGSILFSNVYKYEEVWLAK